MGKSTIFFQFLKEKTLATYEQTIQERHQESSTSTLEAANTLTFVPVYLSVALHPGINVNVSTATVINRACCIFKELAYQAYLA